MGSGHTFTADMFEWLHIANVNESYRSSTKAYYIRKMLKYNDRCTGLDYMDEILLYLALQGWYKGLTTRELEKLLPDMMVAIGNCLSDLASSDDEEDGQDEVDADTELGKLRNDNNPGWAVGTISKTVKQCMERMWLKKMNLHDLTQPGWGDPAHNSCARD